jgi:hypothetical protein
LVPPASYLEKTNGTLEQKRCVLRIDADGFMVSERPQEPDDIRILLLGGSSIENLYIEEDRRVGVRLEDFITGSGRRAKVYSAGISNTNLLHMVNALLNKGLPLRPRIVVYYVTLWPDLMASELDGGFWNSFLGPIRTQGQEAPDPRTIFVSGKGYDDWLIDEKRLLRTLCHICANFEIRLFMATWPIHAYHDLVASVYPDQAVFEAERRKGMIVNELVRTVCLEEKCMLIDLEKGFGALNSNPCFYDLVHPNTLGCERIASLTSDAILQYLD